MCAQRRRRSAWASVRMKKVWVHSYPPRAQKRLWSDWADAQADLSLRWAHMPLFCRALAQMILLDFTAIGVKRRTVKYLPELNHTAVSFYFICLGIIQPIVVSWKAGFRLKKVHTCEGWDVAERRSYANVCVCVICFHTRYCMQMRNGDSIPHLPHHQSSPEIGYSKASINLILYACLTYHSIVYSGV